MMRVGIIGKLPLIRKGQLHFMPWQAFSKTKRPGRPWGMALHALRDGRQQAIAHLLEKAA